MAETFLRHVVDQIDHAIFHAADPEVVDDMGDQWDFMLCHYVAYCRDTWAMLSWIAGSVSWINAFSANAAGSGVSS